MPTLGSVGKLLLIAGSLIAGVGLMLLIFGRLGIGRLPGDIFIQRDNFTFYFPLATMVMVSIVLTILVNLFRR